MFYADGNHSLYYKPMKLLDNCWLFVESLNLLKANYIAQFDSVV